MSHSKKQKGMRFTDRLKAQFLIGILVTVPLGATVLILIWIFNAIDGVLRPLASLLTKHDVPGVGFVGTVLIVYLAGVIGGSLVGRRVIGFSEGVVDRVPFARSIYSMIKQILEGFSSPRAKGFMKVVLIDYPRPDVMSIAFVTNEFADSQGNLLYTLFIPGSPNPTSGFVRIMKATDVTPSTLSVDEALKMLVSFGRVVPEDAGAKLGNAGL